MLEIEKWAKGRNPIVSGIAIKAAFMAEEAFLLSVDAREKTLVSGMFNTPDIKTWLSLYKKSNRIISAVMDPSREAGGFHRLDAWFHDGISLAIKGIRKDKDGVIASIKSMSPDELSRTLRTLNRFSKRWQKGLFQDIENDINNVTDTLFDKEVQNLRESSEAVFFFKVTLPCWFTYAQHPSQLLRLARQGKRHALDKLLRIDPSIIYDPFISRQFHCAAHSPKRSDYLFFADALRKEPKTFKHRWKAKMRIAGIIAFLTGAFNQRLKEPEIRALFDAVAKDLGHGDIDTDLPAAPETFAKHIQRQVRELTKGSELDKK